MRVGEVLRFGGIVLLVVKFGRGNAAIVTVALDGHLRPQIINRDEKNIGFAVGCRDGLRDDSGQQEIYERECNMSFHFIFYNPNCCFSRVNSALPFGLRNKNRPHPGMTDTDREPSAPTDKGVFCVSSTQSIPSARIRKLILRG